MKNLLGFDIGGIKCAVLLGVYNDSDIKITNKQVIKTDKIAPATLGDEIGDYAALITALYH